MKEAITKNKNTTVMGVGLVLMALLQAVMLLFDGNPETNPDWNVVIAEILAGAGLLLASDGRPVDGGGKENDSHPPS